MTEIKPLKELSPVGRTSYEGGDSDCGVDYADFRVWPADGYTKDDVYDAVENFPGTSDVWYTISPTSDRHEYIYVTARERQ